VRLNSTGAFGGSQSYKTEQLPHRDDEMLDHVNSCEIASRKI
jgi:hypothetical protein